MTKTALAALSLHPSLWQDYCAARSPEQLQQLASDLADQAVRCESMSRYQQAVIP